VIDNNTFQLLLLPSSHNFPYDSKVLKEVGRTMGRHDSATQGHPQATKELLAHWNTV
jgi:hypothetical protein